MKSLEKAINAVIRAAKPTSTEKVERKDAGGRVLAEPIQIGDIFLEAGALLGASQIALLAEAGIDAVPIRRLPSVGYCLIEDFRQKALIDALHAASRDLADSVTLVGEGVSAEIAVDAALASECETVVLFGGDGESLVAELKRRRCRILFDATDAMSVDNVAAAQSKEDGHIILCIPAGLLLDGVLALELFLRPALRAMSRGFEKTAGFLRAELRCKEIIEPMESRIRLVPARLRFKDGTPQVEPVNAEGTASLCVTGALIVVPPDSVPLDRHSIVEVIPLPLDDRFLE